MEFSQAQQIIGLVRRKFTPSVRSWASSLVHHVIQLKKRSSDICRTKLGNTNIVIPSYNGPRNNGQSLAVCNCGIFEMLRHKTEIYGRENSLR